MKLGRFTLQTVSGGQFRTDGGTMYGVVPRKLWSQVVEVDEENRIPQRNNCLLIQTPEQRILVDTGYGPYMSDKQRRILMAEDGDPLCTALSTLGLGVDEIDLVVLTHLHFDHAGGAVRRTPEGSFVPTFPRAEYIVQRGEWVMALAEYPELRAAYSPQYLRPLSESGQLRLIDGDTTITAGISACVTPGHTPWHQSILIEDESSLAMYLGDLCPTVANLPTAWCLGYDLDQLSTRRNKRRILGMLSDRGGWALFDHDPQVAAARIVRDDQRDFRAVDPIDVLSQQQ